MSNWDKLVPDGKGGFDLLKGWGFGRELLHRGGAQILVYLFLMPFIGPLFPILFLLSYVIRTKEGKIENCVTGGILSFVFLLDFWLGGLSWVIFKTWGADGSGFGMNMLLFFGKLNLSLMLIFIALYFLTPYIWNIVDLVTSYSSALIFFFIVFFIMWKALMPICGFITDNTVAETPLFFLDDFYQHMSE
jgi:hypothetical protein